MFTNIMRDRNKTVSLTIREIVSQFDVADKPETGIKSSILKS